MSPSLQRKKRSPSADSAFTRDSLSEKIRMESPRQRLGSTSSAGSRFLLEARVILRMENMDPVIERNRLREINRHRESGASSESDRVHQGSDLRSKVIPPRPQNYEYAMDWEHRVE